MGKVLFVLVAAAPALDSDPLTRIAPHRAPFGRAWLPNHFVMKDFSRRRRCVNASRAQLHAALSTSPGFFAMQPGSLRDRDWSVRIRTPEIWVDAHVLATRHRAPSRH